MKHVNELPQAALPASRRDPPDLDQVVLRALAKEPEDRYQTAEDFIEDLDRVEAGLPIARETATAATAILAGGGPATAATLAYCPATPRRRPPPPRRPPPRPPRVRLRRAPEAACAPLAARRRSCWRAPPSPAGTSTPGPGAARGQRAGRRAYRRGLQRGAGGQAARGGRAAAARWSVGPTATFPGGVVFDQDPEAGHPHPEGRHGDDHSSPPACRRSRSRASSATHFEAGDPDARRRRPRLRAQWTSSPRRRSARSSRRTRRPGRRSQRARP